MKTKTIVVTLIATLCIWSADAAPAIAPEKRLEIERALRLVDAESQIKALIDEGIAAFREHAGPEGPKLAAKIEERLTVKLVLEQCAQLFAKYFTVDELRELNRFYESPIGKKFARMKTEMGKEIEALATKHFEGVVAEANGKAQKK